MLAGPVLGSEVPGSGVLGGGAPGTRVLGTPVRGTGALGGPRAGMPMGGLLRREAARLETRPVTRRRHADQVGRASPLQEQGDPPVDAAGMIGTLGGVLVAGKGQ